VPRHPPPDRLLPPDPTRRVLLQGGLAGALAPLFGACASVATAPRLGFAPVPPATGDAVVVPEGYVATPFMPWGEPVGIAGAPMPAWRDDASASAAEQALQMGMHHDGMQYFPLEGSRRGLLVMNHEYVDDGLLHTTGRADWSAEKVAKSQAAHGISVLEVRLQGGQGGQGGEWQAVRPSPLARRITATTPFAVGGPAAGHPLMRTAADPTGTRVLGTFANCAAGLTPWGTYLSGEENFQDYFTTADTPTRDEQRWGLRKIGWYGWAAHDARFDTVRHPNEPHRFGWVVEVDPHDPTSTPIKRTALGRAVHEGAWVAVTRDGRAVVYSGEDAVFEFIYKFVSRDRIQPGGFKANRELLDHGTLYVARFDAGGRGRWLPLVHGQGPLVAANGFDDQGEVLIKARQASDALRATMMDRPEWLAIDAESRWVYCTLTNNTDRGPGGKADVDAANPRANNTMGQIIRWREDGDFDGEAFEWNHLVLAGDPANERPEARGNTVGDAFGSPDTIAFCPRGVLWIGSDVSTSALNRGDNVRLGNNALLACDVATRTTRRFLVGPVNAEVTGVCFTPDARTMFVNIQHPGEMPSGRNDPQNPRRWSNWPDFRPAGRPRSSTVVVRRRDGGVIGS
jgi:uncharacterized protein